MSVVVTLDGQPDGLKNGFGSKVRNGSITLGTYTTNGVAVTKTTFQLPVILADLEVRNAAGLITEWDKTNGKVKVFRQKDPAAAGGADIALPEVANGVDLSATSFRFKASGR